MNFAALSKLMYDEDGMIKAVELAPNGVVRSVYPQASNADALGLDWESFLDEIQINKLQDASYEYLIWKEGHNGERVIIAPGDRPVGRTAEKPEITCREEVFPREKHFLPTRSPLPLPST